MTVKIRDEEPGDIEAVRQVNLKAFGQPQEAKLVDLLRSNDAITLSLVAEAEERIVGHILFSPVRLESDYGLEGAGLAPMAVLPEFQNKGIGSSLVREGVQRIRNLGIPFIIVVGHADYYPRFGFVPANRYSIKCEWEVPDEVFMILPLNEWQLNRIAGTARYREEFKTSI